MLRIFLLLAFTVYVAAEGSSMILSEGNFTSTLNKYDAVAVMFYAPWCKHSKELLPLWDGMRALEGGSVSYAKVDCVTEGDLYWDHKIESFPTLIVFVGGEDGVKMVYDGERNVEDIQSFVENLSGPHVLSLSNEAANVVPTGLHALLNIPVSSPEAGEDFSLVEKKFDAACKKINRVPCYKQTHKDSTKTNPMITISLAQEHGGSVSLSGKPWSTDLPKKYTAEKMVDMIEGHSYPLVVEFNRQNSDLIFSQKRPGFANHFLLILNDINTPENREIIHNTRVVASGMVGECLFIYIDVNDMSDYTQEILSTLKIFKEEAPIAAAVISKKDSIDFYINSDGNLKNEELYIWSSSVLEGKVTPSDTNDFSDKSL